MLSVSWRRDPRVLDVSLPITGAVGGGVGYLAGESDETPRRLPNGHDRLLRSQAVTANHASYFAYSPTSSRSIMWHGDDPTRCARGPGTAVGRFLSRGWVAVVLGVAIIGTCAESIT